MIPEFFIEDIADYALYLMKLKPEVIEKPARVELLNLCFTFLSSTWYIKNPFLKTRLVQVCIVDTNVAMSKVLIWFRSCSMERLDMGPDEKEF